MIEVRAYRSLAELDPAPLEQLNRCSRLASPFASPAWLARFLAHDTDYRALGATALILTAWEGPRLKGYLPLKSTADRQGRKLSCLITVEVDRPQVVARPEDEAGVARAFFRFLLNRTQQWDLLELTQQEPSSPLYDGPALSLNHHWVRRLPDRQGNVLQLGFSDAKAYGAALSQKMRWNVKKQLGALFRAPGLSAMIGSTPSANEALFELYLDVERRSWKVRAAATIGAREATYRSALADPDAGFRIFVCVAFLEGLPFAGSIWAHYCDESYYLQSAYAEAQEQLSPGTLMTWLPIEDAIARGRKRVNLLPDFGYYKSRWLAEPIKTQTVQVFRVGSRYHLKAVLGDLRRRLARAGAEPEASNPYKVAAGKATGIRTVDRPRLEALARRAQSEGAVVLGAAQLAILGPFV